MPFGAWFIKGFKSNEPSMLTPKMSNTRHGKIRAARRI